MPRTVQLESHMSVEELKKAYRSSTDPIEARRWHLVWKIAVGWSLKNSASAVGLSYHYASRIVKKYNQQGAEGIRNQKKNATPHARGSKSLLNQQQLEKLSQALKTRPADGGIWSGPKVARWIEKETARKKVGNQRGWDYLKKCSYSWQSPRPKHRKGCRQEQEKFKQELPQKVQQLEEKFPKAKVEVWFFDEHRVGLKPILRKTWSKVGERPIAEVEHRYQWLYVYGFVEAQSGRTQWYLIPRVNTQWLNLVYREFAKEVGVGTEKIVLLVEDNAGWHRS